MSEQLIDHHQRLASDAPQGWWVCMTASLFFFYEFIQMNMPNALSHDWMHTFGIRATDIGRLASIYFIANVIFLIPAGILLDRFSTKRIILWSMLICVGATIGLGCVQTMQQALVCRFLTGIGSAFCFLSVIRLAARWFDSSRLGYVIGWVLTVAMLGGLLAQAPLVLLTDWLGWRMALWIDGALGFALWLVIVCVVKDCPVSQKVVYEKERRQLQYLGYWVGFRWAFLRVQNWLAAFYTCLMNLPVILLGGVWGILYLTHQFDVTRPQASAVTMMLFFGTIVGAPLVGWVSDRLGKRRLPMMWGTILSFLLIVVMWTHLLHTMSSLMFLFFLIGLVTSTQVLSYSAVAENSHGVMTAMSVSVVNMTTQGGLAVFEQAYGHLMDRHAYMLHHAPGVYTAADFSWASWIFPVALVVAGIAVFVMKETCQAGDPDQEQSILSPVLTADDLI